MVLKRNGKRIKIKVNRTVDLSTAYTIIESVKESCFDDDGRYMSAYYDLLWKRAILIAYTDFELPDDLNEVYGVVYTGDFFRRVQKKINPDQYHAIRFATREAIKDKRDVYADEMRKDLESARHTLVDLSKGLEEATAAAKIFETDDMQALLSSLQDSAKHVRETAKDEDVVADIRERIK